MGGIKMQFEEYNRVQRLIFKRYNVPCQILNDTVKFFSMCSKIAEEKECRLCYSTIKKIIKIVRKYY